MAFCSNCGKELADEANICSNCGTRIKTVSSLNVDIYAQLTIKGEPDDFTTIDLWLAHLDKSVEAKIPNKVSRGQIIRLRGLGLTDSDGVKGDAYIHLMHIDYEQTKKERESQRTYVYEGTVHKCPMCGDTIDAYETICESCGFELRERATTSVVHELATKLENTDSVKKKEELIRNFYIPNTKEDIYEFFILATSNMKGCGANTEAWFVKLEQAYQKAKLAIGHSSEFVYFQEMYAKAVRTNKINFIFRLAKIGYVWAALLIVIGGLFCFIGGNPEHSGLSVGGIFCILGGAYVALMTMIMNDDKKKNK